MRGQHVSVCLRFICLFSDDKNEKAKLPITFSQQLRGEHGCGSLGGCAPFVYLSAELSDWKLVLLYNESYLPSSWAEWQLHAQAAALE